MQPHTHVLVIGGGVGGLLSACALLRAGVDHVTVVDKDSLSERVENETLEQVGCWTAEVSVAALLTNAGKGSRPSA